MKWKVILKINKIKFKSLLKSKKIVLMILDNKQNK